VHRHEPGLGQHAQGRLKAVRVVDHDGDGTSAR
jgi:hypothetical protein